MAWLSSCLLVATLLTLAGCSQPNALTRRQGMFGSLKTNVAQLESEKDKLSRELAELKTENRRIESQLAETEAQNGELAARLDDARAVMSRQGLDDGRVAPRAASDDGTRRKAAPAKVRPKKTPFAQIPSQKREVEESPESDSDDLLDSPRFQNKVKDIDPQARRDDRSPWTTGEKTPASPRRVLK